MTRSEKILEARRLRDEGWTAPRIGRKLGVNESTIRNWYLGDDCIDCGAPITFNSTTDVTERCIPCQIALQHDEKYWTRERVLEAIRRFAVANGRAPTADQWRRSDPVRGYPSTNSCFRTSSNPSAPFPSWQEALATAGYPGAYSGRRTIKEGTMPKQSRYGYVILHENEDGLWEVVKQSDEGTQLAALNESLNGAGLDGRWLAIPGSYWRPRAIKPRTIYDWADDAEAPVPA